MNAPLSLAVVGAGLIGRKHAALIRDCPGAQLMAIVDPAEVSRTFAADLGARWYPDMADLLSDAQPDGVVIATPNQMHRQHALAAISAGIPVLVEKPLADTVAAGAEIVAKAMAADVPVLVGHHRRHNPLIGAARAQIETGQLGRIVAVHGQFWLMKPDDYFDATWRRAPGAGPVLINLIHDVDLLAYLCGPIASVTAIESSATRGFEVEDTAAALLRFKSGALGTLTVSDTISAPWSWEMTAAENPAYPSTGEACYLIGGTGGSLSIPQGARWHHPDARSWWEPLNCDKIHTPPEDPLVRQIAHFCAVIRGEAPALVSGADGLAALRVIEALKTSAQTGREQQVVQSCIA